jgi:hypothetical protein
MYHDELLLCRRAGAIYIHSRLASVLPLRCRKCEIEPCVGRYTIGWFMDTGYERLGEGSFMMYDV